MAGFKRFFTAVSEEDSGIRFSRKPTRPSLKYHAIAADVIEWIRWLGLSPVQESVVANGPDLPTYRENMNIATRPDCHWLSVFREARRRVHTAWGMA